MARIDDRSVAARRAQEQAARQAREAAQKLVRSLSAKELGRQAKNAVRNAFERPARAAARAQHRAEQLLGQVVGGARDGVKHLAGLHADAPQPGSRVMPEIKLRQMAPVFGGVINLHHPPPKDSLRVMTYNASPDRFKKFDQLAATIEKSGADVVGLQECDQATALKLAARLKMNVAYFGAPGTAGKAVLSRYPIGEARHVDFTSREKEGEIRGVLDVTVKVGKKEVDILDTHLTLRDSGANAEQVQALADRIAAKKAEGRSVVAMGDFNTNFNLGARQLGNADDARDAEAIRRLKGLAGDAFASKEARIVLRDGRELSPKQARAMLDGRYVALLDRNLKAAAELKAKALAAKDPAEAKKLTAQAKRLDDQYKWLRGGLDPAAVKGPAVKKYLEEAYASLGISAADAGRQAELLDAAEGASHLTADKRFDNVLTTLPVKSARIDYRPEASDHQPMLVDVSLE